MPSYLVKLARDRAEADRWIADVCDAGYRIVRQQPVPQTMRRVDGEDRSTVLLILAERLEPEEDEPPA